MSDWNKDNSNIPETPETPSAPDAPETQEAPATPEAPPAPAAQETPAAPEAPPAPVTPVPPQNPYGYNPYTQPAAWQNPYVQNPYVQNVYAQNPYAQPPKRKMPLGLKVLIICLSVALGISVFGFAGYAAYTAVNGANRGIISGDLPFGPGPQLPEETPEDMPETDAPEIPDIPIVPNTEGIQLNPQPKTAELSPSAVYDHVIQSTVLVTTTTGDGSYGTGTGIIATADGYIITNSHVVLNTKNVSVQVKTNDGETHDAVVVGFDKTSDLAVLKIDGSGYTPAEFGNSDELVMGQWVLVIGNPGGEQFSGSLTRGVISGLNREVGDYSESGMTFLQTDAAINPGNSGGPLVNMYGQVVGISSSKIVSEKYEGMCFAIPITSAKSILDDLLSGGYVHGRVRFGITGNSITSAQAAVYGVPAGFMIREINEDSCFVGTEAAAFDIITAVDGIEVDSLESLSNVLLSYDPGDTATVSLFRPNEEGTGGTDLEVTVTLLEDKGETQG